MFTAYTTLFYLTATPTSDTHTLSLHDALPIYHRRGNCRDFRVDRRQLETDLPAHARYRRIRARDRHASWRSEEHTSELQSPDHLVCRLRLEKKNRTILDTRRKRVGRVAGAADR